MTTENESLPNMINAKAGMESVDTEKVNKIIIESSKGSKFYDNELKKNEILTKQLIKFKKIADKISQEEIERGEIEADEYINEILDDNQFFRCIIHIDMDAFYASAEILDDPNLRNKPMAVGSLSMLSTSNYLARKYGVRAAMPGFIALKLCPELEIIEPDFNKYAKINKHFRAIFAEYDPNYLSVGLDEAYLDLTDHLIRRYSYDKLQMTFTSNRICKCPNNVTKDTVPPMDMVSDLFRICVKCGTLVGNKTRVFNSSMWSAVEELRFRVFNSTGLTCSAGIASNTLLSKIASDIRKPNGQYQISSDDYEIEQFMKNLSVRKVPGIGKISEKKLQYLDIETCSDILKMRGLLYHLFKPITFKYFLRMAKGLGQIDLCSQDHCDPNLDPDKENTSGGTFQKSMSMERTFNDCTNHKELLSKCSDMAVEMVRDLIDARLQCKLVGIKMKLASFELRVRSQQLLDYTNDLSIISGALCELLASELHKEPHLCLRLFGVKLSGFISEEILCKKSQWSLQQAFDTITSKQQQPQQIKQQEQLKQQPQIQPQNICDLIPSTSSYVASNEQATPDCDSSQVKCPVCQIDVESRRINIHLDECLTRQLQDNNDDDIATASNIQNNKRKDQTAISQIPDKKSKLKDGKLDKYFIKK